MTLPTFTENRELAKEGDTVWVLVNHVKPDKREQFEHFINDVFFGKAHRLSEADQRVFRQTRVLHPVEPDEDGNYPYLFIMDPVIPEASYSIYDYLVKMYDEQKAEEYNQLFEDTLARDQSGYTVIQSGF